MWKQFWPSSYRGQGQAGGTAGERDVIRAILRAERAFGRAAHDEGEGA